MTQKRGYSSKVKLGNWFEDQLLKEDEYLEQKEIGELVSKTLDFLEQNIFRPVNLTERNDGILHFGDVVMLVNMGGENRECSAVSINADMNSLTMFPSPGIRAPCGVTAGRNIQACTRTAFIITSVDGSPEGSALHFEQSFALKTSCFASGLYLTSYAKSFHKCAEKSRLQEVNLDDDCSFQSWWKIVHFDPKERLESEGQPAPANVKVLIKHCKTNQGLAALGDHILRTSYGKEYEVTAHTFLNARKVEKDNNHWILCTSDPAGNRLVLLNHPQSVANNRELIQEEILNIDERRYQLTGLVKKGKLNERGKGSK